MFATPHHIMKHIRVVAFLILALRLAVADATAAEHPGNIFLVGDTVQVNVPVTWSGWRAIDIDRNEVAAGAARDGKANLGQLPVGYFEIREKDGPGMITAAVLAKSKPVKDTPIAIDAAMSWFYADPQQIRDACALCRMAGVNWVRDRFSWPEIETARGTWAGETRYERAMKIQHDEGLKILQVNHIAPPWATSTPNRFVEDLRDVHNFYRGIAERWKELADAIEPWNEPDIELFGGHTGCEIASFQKAAYLGLKAGDPDKPVCGTVFAVDRAETLDEFAPNEVYPYFDRYNLHHYIGLPAYPRAYGRHRAVSAGRPMWTTEFNLTINWADEKTQEPSEEDLRRQAYRVSKVFSGSLHEGVEKAFYFILGHYVERTLQYGLVHHDLTPRPAYVAFAAVGRLLNGAKPIGRVDLGDEKLKAYVFNTVLDGAPRETLVAWSETNPTNVKTRSAEKLYDYLGRELPLRNNVKLTPAPVFMILPPGGSDRFKVEPPPAKPKWKDGKPSSVVLQLLGKGDFKQSAFVVGDTKQLRLAAYNFSTKPARGKLTIEGATASDNTPLEIELNPGERKELPLTATSTGTVTVKFQPPGAESAIVSARTTTTESTE
jgi:hypothetical protein